MSGNGTQKVQFWALSEIQMYGFWRSTVVRFFDVLLYVLFYFYQICHVGVTEASHA